MALKSQIDSDLKSAMLAGDKQLVTVIRGIKSAILNAEISSGNRQEGLSDNEVIVVLQKEAKKRTDAVEMYKKAGESEKAEAELYEKTIIEGYLPEQMSDSELVKVINECIADLGEPFDRSKMGVVIGAVKARVGASADGATIARLVQEKF